MATITDLTGTKWLLNETFDYMPNGNYIWDSYGGSDEYDINFSSNMTNYTKLGFYDGDWLESSNSIWYYRYVGGSNYYDIGWQNEVWLDESYRTIEITGGTDVTNPTLIAWLEANAIQQDAGYSITYEENGGSTVTDLTEQTVLPSPLPTTTKANHVFAGWYYDNLFTQKATAGDSLSANVTLYAKWYTPSSWFEDVADAIREKEGSSDLIKHVDFPDKIKNIQGAKPEETKTVTPNFASGNVDVTPTSGKVLSQVTINKDTNLIADNIKKDITVHGITGNSFVAIELTQAQYDALATPDTNTYYIVVEEE